MTPRRAARTPMQDMYREIKTEVVKRWGGGWSLISADMRQALVNSRILEICVQQDDKLVPDSAVRRTMNELYDEMVKDFHGNGARA